MWALGCLLFELAQFECVSAPCMWIGGVLPVDTATLLLSETYCCARRCLSGVYHFPLHPWSPCTHLSLLFSPCSPPYSPPFLANDMPSLSSAVRNTAPRRISKHYSDDLAGIVNQLLEKVCCRAGAEEGRDVCALAGVGGDGCLIWGASVLSRILPSLPLTHLTTTLLFAPSLPTTTARRILAAGLLRASSLPTRRWSPACTLHLLSRMRRPSRRRCVTFSPAPCACCRQSSLEEGARACRLRVMLRAC